MVKLAIDGIEIKEADCATVIDALELYADVCHGRIDQVGQVLCSEFAARRDVTAAFRKRVEKVRESFRLAHEILHGTKDYKASWKANADAVPTSGIRAYQLLCKLRGDAEDSRLCDDDIRTQSEMNDPK